EGYASPEMATASGEAITGRIEREDDQVVVIRPLSAADDAATIRKRDIRSRALSKVSNMPAGIINTLAQTQILDLLAYLISESDVTRVAFKPSVATGSDEK